MMVATPPATTAAAGQKIWPVIPDSAPPSSFDAPTKTVSIASTRPRLSRGVTSGAIVARMNTEIESAAELPAGWVDAQEGGTYRLERRDDEALFGHNHGHDSLKSFLFPPRVEVWQGRRDAVEHQDDPASKRYAFLGVRSCDLHAVAIQDRVFIGDHFVEPDYERRRRDAEQQPHNAQ